MEERMYQRKPILKMASDPPSSLFPRLEGPNTPPVLTTSSQPVLKIAPEGLATLPKMRLNGPKPKFSSELKTESPYQKN